MKSCACLWPLLWAASIWAVHSADVGTPASANDYLSSRWTMRDGLPSDSITALLPAEDGYLWVGTTAGLARFDGVRFLRPDFKPGSAPAGTHITALCEDNDGRLWVGTQEDGLLQLCQGQVTRFAETNQMSPASITCLAADPAGGVWIGTRNGLFHWQQRRLAHVGTEDGLPDETVLGVHVARSGNVWITTRVGVCQLRNGHIVASDLGEHLPGRSADYVGAYEDAKGDLWGFGDSFLVNLTQGRRFNYFKIGDPVATRVWTLHEGHDGALWIGTSGRGLFRFADGRFDAVKALDDRQLRDVRAVSTDPEGDVWVGTHGGGLVRLTPAELRWLDVRSRSGGAANALTADAAGHIWVSLKGDGLFVVRGAGGDLPADPRLAVQNHVLALCTGAHGALWIGTWGAGIYRIDVHGVAQFTLKDGLLDNVVTAVGAAREASAFAGTRSGDVQRYVGRDWVPWGTTPVPAGVTVLLHARNGTLWVGTDGEGLWKIRDQGSPAEPGPSELRGAVVRALLEDDSGRVWAGTAARGLMCITAEGVRRATIHDGLPGNAVSQLLADSRGNLWLGTDEGIYELPREAAAAFATSGRFSQPRPVGENEHVPDFRCLPGARSALRTRDGMLWFATASGVAGVNPGTVRKSAPPPEVSIEEVLVNDRQVRSPWIQASPATMELGYPLRSLEIHCTALRQRAPETVKFKYKLEGFDEDWTAAGLERLVRYQRLPSGRYRFCVIASGGSGVWSEPATFSFVVPTPFWRTWWVLVLAGAATLGSVAAGARKYSNRRLRRRLQRLQQEQMMERERTRIARDMHDELGAKLTKVSFLSERLKTRAAKAPELAPQIDSIAGTTRELLKSLDEIVWAVNPKNDTLEHLANYLGQYADEYFENTAVECAVEMPEVLPHAPLSADRRHNLFLAFEEALNNVLKHAQASRVWVRMRAERSVFGITVQDNGRGFQGPAEEEDSAPPPDQHGCEGNGLGNMRARLADAAGKCRITTAAGQGTTVELEIPLQNTQTGTT